MSMCRQDKQERCILSEVVKEAASRMGRRRRDNLGQAKASTGTETATLNNHSHNEAFSQRLAGSVSLLRL